MTEILAKILGPHLIAVTAWPDILEMARNEFKADLAPIVFH